MPKIVVTNNQDFTEAQKQRLESLGEVTYYDPIPQTAEEYLERVEGADIVCSGHAGLKDAYPKLHDVYVTVTFVNVSFVDTAVLSKNHVTISNAPGANRHAVSEWIMFMMLLMMREFDDSLNRTKTYRQNGAIPPLTPGLGDRKLTILGQGSIGKRVGDLATAFEMQVSYFKRGDDLKAAVKNADVVVDTLSTNPTTAGLLNAEFFAGIKQGARFITVTGPQIVDYDALLAALDSNHLAGAASDCGNILVGDTDDPLYQKLAQHPKMQVTPHIAWNSEKAARTGADIMIDNVEAWLAGKPLHLVN